MSTQVKRFPWESLFYDPIYMLAGAGDTPQDDLLRRYFNVLPEPMGIVADIGCGTGRFTLPLLKAGWQVVAIDANAKMLEALRHQLSATHLTSGEVTLEHASLAQVEIAPVQAAVAGDDFLSHFLGLKELREAMMDIKRLLLPGMCCYTDLRPRSTVRLQTAASPSPKPLQAFGITPAIEFGGESYNVAVTGWDEYDAETRIITSHQQFSRLNAQGVVVHAEFKTIRQRFHTLEEVVRIGRECDLRVESVYEFGSEHPQAWLPGHLLILTSERC